MSSATYAERYGRIRKRISKAVADTAFVERPWSIGARRYVIVIRRGDIDFDRDTHLTVPAHDALQDAMRAYAAEQATVDQVKAAWQKYVAACRVVYVGDIARYEPDVERFADMQTLFDLPAGERTVKPDQTASTKRRAPGGSGQQQHTEDEMVRRDTRTTDMFAPAPEPAATPPAAPAETSREDAPEATPAQAAQTSEPVADSTSCVKETENLPPLAVASVATADPLEIVAGTAPAEAVPAAPEREQEPPRTARAVQARKLAAWRSQEVDGTYACTHGVVLALETCDAGCQQPADDPVVAKEFELARLAEQADVLGVPAEEIAEFIESETSEAEIEIALADDEAPAAEQQDTDQNALFEFSAPVSERVQIFDDALMVDKAFEHHRAQGFPYRVLSPALCMQQINDLSRTEGKTLLHTTAAYQVADTYHPHRMHASATGKKAPFEAFNDDKKLRHAIELELKWRKLPRVFAGGYLTIVLGTQACSNFRPGFAVYLYREFAPDNAVVLDTSTGYGGRLVGAIASQKVSRYIGIDPNVPTHEGNLRLAADLGLSGMVELYNQPAEDVEHVLLADRCDFAFTSPPYFSKERYSTDATQSWVRYKTAEAWRQKFLLKMLELQYVALKAGSYSVINIAAVTIKDQKYALDEWTKEDAQKVGFTYVRTEQFPMQSRFGAHQDEEVAIEPVLVFKKEG